MSRKKQIGILLILLFAAVGLLVYVFAKMTSFKQVDIGKTDEELGIQSINYSELVIRPSYPYAGGAELLKTDDLDNQIINIALFGIDRRNGNERGRSDAIIIATLDFQHGKIKLISLMRDLEVPIEGHGRTKLNHAYAYGGAPLAVKTINQNFGLDIRDYVTVDFFMLASIIDALGGIEVDVRPEEIQHINKYIKEMSGLKDLEPNYLEESGRQTLSGIQAVAYARIRSVGNGDFQRTERQKQVLVQIIEKMKEKGVTAVPKLLMELSPYVETSLSRTDILSMAYQYFKHGNMVVEQQRFPLDGTWESGYTKSGSWVIRTDLEKMKNAIQQYVYTDVLMHANNEDETNRKGSG